MNKNFSPRYTSKYNSISGSHTRLCGEKVMTNNHKVSFSAWEVRGATRKSIQNSYTKRIEKENMRKYD